MFSIGNEDNATLIARIGYSGIIFIPAAIYESMCSYLSIKTVATKIIYLASFLFLVTLWTTNKFITGSYLAPFGYYPAAGFLHMAYMVMVAIIFVASVLSITKKIKHEKKVNIRLQIMIFHSGLIIYAGASVDYVLNYPDLLHKLNIQLYPVGVLFIIVSIFVFMLAHKSQVNQLLGQQIEERNDELRKSLAMLKEAQETKKKFIASITHDLKNPLSVISGYAEILELKLAQGSKEHKAAGSINICANQMGRLLDSLIQISLLESGEMKPDLDIYDYSCFIGDYLKRFEEKAQLKNINLSWRNQECRMIIKSDILWLERILGNLIQNAFKYVDSGGSIDVKVYADREYVYTEVNDTGIGIPKDKLEFIFIRKYQAHKELKKEGYGLGLSIVKEMLELIGGGIKVESHEGIGTRFTYSIPLYTDQAATAKNGTVKPGITAERRSGLDRRKENRTREIVASIEGSVRLEMTGEELLQYENKKNALLKNVLICDDNPSHLRLLADKLAGGFNLFLVESGEAGLQKLSHYITAIDAVITDVEMPAMNGIAFCKKIKENDKLKDIPVIVMSSYYNVTDKEHSMKSGAACYIEKNKTKEEMAALINAVTIKPGMMPS